MRPRVVNSTMPSPLLIKGERPDATTGEEAYKNVHLRSRTLLQGQGERRTSAGRDKTHN